MRSFVDGATCPACAGQGMEYTAEQIDLPYLGESLETVLRCLACGYRHADFVLTEIRTATRHSLRVAGADEMAVRVVRASSGTLRIPELGIDIEPGVAADAYVTNVEGIFVRVERVLGQLHQDGNDEARARIDELAATLQALREGKADPVTLVLEDPFGNSAILGEGVKVEELSPEEAARLQTGTVVVDPGNPGGAEAA